MFKHEFSKSINWGTFTIKVAPSLFTRKFFSTNLSIFWTNIVEKYVSENQHIYFLFNLKWTSGESDYLGGIQKLNKEDKDYILNFIIDEIEDKSEYYKTTNMVAMIFSYNIKNGRAKDKIVLENTNLHFQDYQHHKLPITMNPLEYGKLIEQIDNKYWIQINKTNSVIINQINDENIVKLYRSGELRYKYIDKKVDNFTFTRTLENKQFTFKNNELALLTIDKSVKFIEPLKRARKY